MAVSTVTGPDGAHAPPEFSDGDLSWGHNVSKVGAHLWENPRYKYCTSKGILNSETAMHTVALTLEAQFSKVSGLKAKPHQERQRQLPGILEPCPPGGSTVGAIEKEVCREVRGTCRGRTTWMPRQAPLGLAAGLHFLEILLLAPGGRRSHQQAAKWLPLEEA